MVFIVILYGDIIYKMHFVYYYLLFVATYWIASFAGWVMDFWVGCKKIIDRDPLILWGNYKKVFWTVFWNVNVLTLGCIYVTSFFANLGGFHFMVWKMVLDLVVMFVLTDVFVYGAHRMIHWPPLYGWSHKVHHELKVPIAFGALYNHWFDYIFCTFFPIILPAIIVSAHPITILMWIVMTLTNAIIVSHGSYAIRDRLHFYHHQKFNCNYGTGLFMDKIFGTEYLN
ncbi:MAG: hypothetical protein Hyperionvirus15_59 [Hyperionvirus sp.]|uniref:Fatty acid hydroxylase domain-containing protein n=1 Tax=Hyperionvirus sp. TaxID=2487770 RepID=A0A3G5ACN6_9VIRU|nr:MAG: hypothetical protein Hyperionvirus15_59 [Hyperionvirus sp.]